MKWNLSDLYNSVSDPKIARDLKRQTLRAFLFAKKYRGKTRKLYTPTLAQALRVYENIFQEAAKPAIFAHLIFSADTRPHQHGALVQKTEEILTAISNQLRFFELELLRIPEKRLRYYIRHVIFSPWRHFLERLVLFRPHRLAESEENILEQKRATGARAWSRFFTQEHATKSYIFKWKKKERQIGESETLKMLHDVDRRKRIAAQVAFTEGLKEEQKRMTYLFNVKMFDKKINDTLLHYDRPESNRHLDNEISQKAVDALVSVVTQRYTVVQDYYRLKRRILGYKKIYDYDRYAPVLSDSKRFSYRAAQDMIVNSFSRFSPVFGKIAKEFFDKKWIDAEARKGKRGGAFCQYVTPNLHPYISMSFHGTPRDVMTLAHELGHGIHAYLARKNDYLTFDAPLTLAETASVFGELLVFHNLIGSLESPRERLSLLASKIEDVFSTVFRQVAMFTFERRIHFLFREKGELDAATYSRVWRETQQAVFGSSVTLTPGYDLWWSYISHFVHTPFYVYAYAFGQLLTFSLWKKYEKEGRGFVGKFVSFLSAGGSESPTKLLGRLGVDVEDKRFWEHGIEVIKNMVGEAKALAPKI